MYAWLVWKKKGVAGCSQPPLQLSDLQVTEVKKTETENREAFPYFLLSTQDIFFFFLFSMQHWKQKQQSKQFLTLRYAAT